MAKKKESLLVVTGASLKAARQAAGYTMQSLADKMNVARHTITRWESGKSNLTLGTIQKYCDAIDAKVVFEIIPFS